MLRALNSEPWGLAVRVLFVGPGMAGASPLPAAWSEAAVEPLP